jgi:type VI protein secretion system component VasK
MALRHHETSHHQYQQSRILRRSEADYEFTGQFAYLKHHLSEFTKVAFFDSQNRENEIAWPF